MTDKAKEQAAQEKAAEKAQAQAATEGGRERAPRDNRKIVSGVQVMEGATLRTFAGTSEEDHDKLEQLLTAEQVEHLKESGALEGDWTGKAKVAAVMPGSRADRAANPGGQGSGTSAEVQALREENARLRKQIGAGTARATEPAPEDETAKEEQARRSGHKK